ncbi:S8 family peptidase [Rhizobium paknamense]|uniref:Peptidase S8/S53 domain-containing protein n=1 Tax=Rhizobium paknamense TaxID=1206817 RepID=A0ABU0IIH6_9HYPH|nr:S8 family serine peptidase [Rhizobium paknamense]MDQ0458055.1 hypothetical protein [Rhizobium paknamense]
MTEKTLPPNVVSAAKTRHLLTSTQGLAAVYLGLTPMSASDLQDKADALATLEGLEIVRTIVGSEPLQLQGVDSDQQSAQPTYVVQAEPHVMASLPPTVVAEPLTYLMSHAEIASASQTSDDTTSGFTLQVVDENGDPVAGVQVALSTDFEKRTAMTDERGMVQIGIYSNQNFPIKTLRVMPKAWYWDFYAERPELDKRRTNVVKIRSFKTAMKTVVGGWGQELMGLLHPRSATKFRGEGIKVAVIDSGIDGGHDSLAHVVHGKNFNPKQSPDAWNTDEVGHGTHTAGLIGARPTEKYPFTGIAPGVELHVFKIFPYGGSDALLEALDECLRRGVDVVNLSLGQRQLSPILQQRIERLTLNGICCVASAGNDGSAVMFPANSPSSLAISAIGLKEAVVANTYDATQILPGSATDNGLFFARFSSHGPEIDLGAPGVGIISTVPGNAFGAQSGTSMSAPHVTGLIALLLAELPVFQEAGPFKRGTFDRVLAVADIMMQISGGTMVMTPSRAGAGIPTLEGVALPDRRLRNNVIEQLRNDLGAKMMIYSNRSISQTSMAYAAAADAARR